MKNNKEIIAKLVKYFEQCGGMSIAGQMGLPVANDYFELRKSFGIDGYASTETIEIKIKESLGLK